MLDDSHYSITERFSSNTNLTVLVWKLQKPQATACDQCSGTLQTNNNAHDYQNTLPTGNQYTTETLAGYIIFSACFVWSSANTHNNTHYILQLDSAFFGHCDQHPPDQRLLQAHVRQLLYIVSLQPTDILKTL